MTTYRPCLANPPVTDRLLRRIERALGADIAQTADLWPHGTQHPEVAISRAETALLAEQKRQHIKRASRMEPLDWLRTHTHVQWEDKQIKDANDDIGNPRRADDVVDKLFKSGSLTEDEAAAAREFQDDFDLARLDPLRANDIIKPRAGRSGGVQELAAVVEDCRQRVWEAIQGMGGIGSPAGRAAWEVLGERLTIKQFSERMRLGGVRPIGQMQASGLVMGACGYLVEHYAQRAKRRA